jgi:parallel beta-helix repeat protein
VTVSASSGTFKGYGHLLIVAAGTTPPGDPTPVDTSSPPDTTAPLPPPPSSAGDSVDRTCTGCVVLSPGANLQSAVTNRAAGTGFRLTAGVYRNQRVVPKSGNRFVCDPGAVLDGGGTTVYAFEKGSGTSVDTRPKNVTIVGCEVTRYASPDHYGPIRAGGSGASDGTYGWTIDGVNCHHNRVGCVRVGHKTVVRNSWLHHNGWAGIIGAGDSILIEHNEISYNDVSGTPGISLGGSNVNGGFKFVNTRWLVVRNNFSHHNRGAGMWTDINNIYTTYDGNRVEDNTEVGIFHEISYDAVIKNNVVRRNGFAKSSWLWGAGILVAASPNVEVSGNTLAGNYNGIAVVQQNRTESAKYGPHVVNNVRVHDNSVDGGRSGFVQDVGNSGLFTLSHVKFWRNTYTQRVSSPFAWANGWRTGSQWRGYGQDTDGTFTWQ